MKTNIANLLTIFLVTMLCLAGVSLAQEDAAPPDALMEVAQADAATEDAGAEDLIPYTPDDSELDAAVQSKQNKFSISLDEVPLDDVVKMFTKIAPDVNLIVSASNLFDKSVTVNLKDVEWHPALSSILDTHNMQIVETSAGVYTILEKTEDQVNFMSETFKLNYMAVGDVMPVIQAMLPVEPPGASISPFTGQNVLVVRSTPGNLTQVADLIAKLDVPTEQVAVETKFMELTAAASKQLGINWGSLESFGISGSLGPFTRDETAARNLSRVDSSLTFDNRQQTDNLAQDFNNFNAPYPSSASAPYRTTTDTISRGQDFEVETIDTFSRTINEAQAAILTMDQLNIVLSALQTTDGVSIISNPKIIVTSGYTGAVFRVGVSEPIIKTEISRGTAESPGDVVSAALDEELDTEYIKQGYMHTGIELKVVPAVKNKEKGLIEASIFPKLTRKDSDKTVGNNSWPIISVKEITTKFTLRDGQTVAIGGLTDSRDQKETSKIPLLGDIPLIGRYLFSHTSDVTRQVETIIFVTLSIADPNDIGEFAGMPEDAHLVHNKRLQLRAQQKRNLQETQRLDEAINAEMEQEAERLRERLLRRDK